ncbi:MAG: FtsX-like permease family protein, partial [Actinobacteria bacterium]
WAEASTAGPQFRRATVQIIARDGALNHVQRLASANIGGVWVTDTTATALHVGPGDQITVDVGTGKTLAVTVAGVYRDLATAPLARYWCSIAGDIIPMNAFSNSLPPPPVVLADRSFVLYLADRLGTLGQLVIWEFPVDERGLTLEEAIPTANSLAAIADRLSPPVGNNECGRLGCLSGHTDLPAVIERAQRTVDSLRSPVAAVSWSGRLVALALLAGAAVYWTVRRRTEVNLLSARGVGPFRVAGRVALETFVPLLIAAGLGWAAAVSAIRTFGPSSVTDAGARRSGLETALWMVGGGLVLLSLAVASVARRSAETSETHHRLPLRRVPWDIVIAALAGASLYELLTRGTGPVTSTSGKLELDVLVLLFPILFTAAGAGLAARALGFVLPRVARTAHRGAPSVYLALRRLATSGAMAIGLVAAVTLGVGVLSYSGVLGSSLSATERAKAEVFTGSDFSADVSEVSIIPTSLANRATHVKAIPLSTFLGVGQMQALAIDPRTFDRAAFWDPSFADRPLRALLDAMRAPRPDGRIPVIVVGVNAPATGRILIGYGAGGFQEARVVGLAKHFPGSTPGRALLVLPLIAPRVDDAPGADQFWVRGDAAAAERVMRQAGLRVFTSVSADEVEQTADLAALAWVFAFLLALGVVTALISVVGAVLYLQARQRGRVVAHALAHRMGLSKAALRLSVAIELSAILATGVVLGLGLGMIAARLVVGRLDPVPYLAPGMLLRVPFQLWLVVAATAAGMAWLGGWAAQLAADRTNVAAALRTSA